MPMPPSSLSSRAPSHEGGNYDFFSPGKEKKEGGVLKTDLLETVENNLHNHACPSAISFLDRLPNWHLSS